MACSAGPTWRVTASSWSKVQLMLVAGDFEESFSVAMVACVESESW